MAQAVFCLAQTEAQAIMIVDQLRAAGFSSNDISVLFPDKTGTRDFAHEQHTKVPEGAATGAGTGGVLGGTLGWLVGIGALAIPGLGPFIAAGPIMAALSGAAAGAEHRGTTADPPAAGWGLYHSDPMKSLFSLYERVAHYERRMQRSRAPGGPC